MAIRLAEVVTRLAASLRTVRRWLASRLAEWLEQPRFRQERSTGQHPCGTGTVAASAFSTVWRACCETVASVRSGGLSNGHGVRYGLVVRSGSDLASDIPRNVLAQLYSLARLIR